MVFKEKYGVMSKIVINEEIIEQVSNFKYFGCEISVFNSQEDICIKKA
jgi:hypothetical protein